ncbi:MAG: radical SAM/SPASM domain-containing protein [Acidobacteriota bacterium]
MGWVHRLKTSYYVPMPEDGLARRIWRSATRRRAPDFPRTIQIQTVTGCNGACVFCPYPLTVESQPKGSMSQEMFERVIEEAAAHGVRRISPYLMNEPFLDPTLLDKLAFIRERAPGAKVVLTTNGSRLTPDVADRLLAMDALHSLYISFQGVEKAAYESTMRGSLVFERTLENVLGLVEKWKRKGGRSRFSIVVTMVQTNRIDAEKAVAFWRSKGVESKWTPLENRGRLIATAQELAPPGRPLRPYAHCTRLFKQAYLLFNGDLVLCCTDYTRKMVLGNIQNSTLRDVWNSPKAWTIRRLYSEGRLDQLPLCEGCEIG